MSENLSAPNMQYTDEFKIETVKLCESNGGNKRTAQLGDT
jgi:hypothetical protein